MMSDKFKLKCFVLWSSLRIKIPLFVLYAIFNISFPACKAVYLGDLATVI